MTDADVVVVGAGAVGASTALHLARAGIQALVLEKEVGPARHQSGRNSGVIHAGYNPEPGTEKARYCVEGNRRLRAFCLDQDVPMQVDGILVIARHDGERDTLEVLHRRAQANGVQTRLLEAHEILEREPHAAGVAALHAPEGGSVDAAAYVAAMVREAERDGATFRWNTRVRRVRAVDGGMRVDTDAGPVTARVLVNCAGLQADRIAAGVADDLRVIPFRGTYVQLRPEARHLVRSHVYAVPDLAFPFLGVHASRQTDGRVLVGPGAMLAFGREAYSLARVQPRDLAGTLAWPGFRRLVARPEFRALVRREFAKSVRRKAVWREAKHILPDLHTGHLARARSGNRAQLVDREGNLVQDLVVRETERAVHVLNVVSPGLTASLPFGEHVAARAAART